MTSAHADDASAVDTRAIDTRAVDARAVASLRATDDELLADLYHRWSSLVYSLALGSLGDVAQAEAVTSRVFSRAWAARETSRTGPTRFPEHPVDLARREVADVLAAAGPPPKIESEEFGGSESSGWVLAERLLVADGVAHLDTSSRRVLQMALDDGLTAGEIAGRTGLRVEEVRSRLASGLTELRHRQEGDADAH